MGRAAFLAGSSKLVRHMESKAPRHSFLPDILYLRKCLCVLSSALWSGILVPSPFPRPRIASLQCSRSPRPCCEGCSYWGEQRSSGVGELCLNCLQLLCQTQHQWVQLSPLCPFGCHYSLWPRVSQLSSADKGKGFLLIVLDIFSTGFHCSSLMPGLPSPPTLTPGIFMTFLQLFQACMTMPSDLFSSCLQTLFPSILNTFLHISLFPLHPF